ncbi:MAG: hypothetical protein KA100_00775 [Rickettsiales bacterium]|nr:hypothetical protein [Rickettsiales bacterium]
MNSAFLTNLQNALPILLAIFVVVFLLIVITRIVLTFLLNQAYKRYLALKKTSKKLLFLKKKKFDKEDEELMRKKAEIPRAHSAVKAELQAKGGQKESGSYEIISSNQQEFDKQEMNQINIVDIVKPVGFWTSMILGQKLTYLIQSAQVLNKRGDKGFWASMIEAKEREAGRQHSRGR